MSPLILFVGDSITHGMDWASKIDFAEVKNIAVPGYLTDDVRAQLSEIKRINPKVISMLIGTNDFGNTDVDRTGTDVGQRISEIIRSILDSSDTTQIVISSILPRDFRFAGRIRAANRIVSSVTHDRITYLDCWPALSHNENLRPEFLLTDGFDVHLNSAGYEAWSKVLVPTLKKRFV